MDYLVELGSNIPGVYSIGQSGSPTESSDGYVVVGEGAAYNFWETQLYEEYIAGGGNPYDYARPGYELP
uniref:hypothetical protein n=1 Tax=uncultured Caulobacter sp. TaxID=158749 RepID=UPI0025F84974|nr:hypothetical protein [uncultured Caulobacter sp.]